MLNNSYLSGHKIYPVTVEGAVTMLSYYMNENAGRPPVRGQYDPETDGPSLNFAQVKKKKQNVVCYKCKKKGHYAWECDARSNNSDDESSASRSRASSHIEVGWAS